MKYKPGSDNVAHGVKYTLGRNETYLDIAPQTVKEVRLVEDYIMRELDWSSISNLEKSVKAARKWLKASVKNYDELSITIKDDVDKDQLQITWLRPESRVEWLLRQKAWFRATNRERVSAARLRDIERHQLKKLADKYGYDLVERLADKYGYDLTGKTDAQQTAKSV